MFCYLCRARRGLYVKPKGSTCRDQNPDKSRAGQDWTPAGRSVQETADPFAPRASQTTVLNDSSSEWTKEILCKPTEERNDRLTRGLPAGRRRLFVPGRWPVDRRLFVSVNPYHARYVREQLGDAEFFCLPILDMHALQKKGSQRPKGICHLVKGSRHGKTALAVAVIHRWPTGRQPDVVSLFALIGILSCRAMCIPGLTSPWYVRGLGSIVKHARHDQEYSEGRGYASLRFSNKTSNKQSKHVARNNTSIIYFVKVEDWLTKSVKTVFYTCLLTRAVIFFAQKQIFPINC